MRHTGGLRAGYHISFAPKRWLLCVGWLEESLNALGINRPCRNVICFPPPRKGKKAESSCVLLVFRPLIVVCWLIHLFVADHLCTAFAVVEVVCDANHSHGADVVGGSSLN
jgi:hypothetical protein